MTNIKLLLVTALAVLAAAMAGRTLSSDPEWQYLSSKGTDVAMEELVLSFERRDRAPEGGGPAGGLSVDFKSDYFKLD